LGFTWPTLYWDLDSFLFRELMRNVGYWMWSANYKIVEYGDLPYRYQNDRCLVVMNHQCTADVPTLCAAICKKGVGSGKMLWILDTMFRYSHFGWVSRIRGDFFIKQGRNTRHMQGPLLTEHMKRVFWNRERRWCMVFPEGGFLYKRLEASQKYAKENGYAVLKHVTLPRVGAMKALLDVANPFQRSDSIEGQKSENGPVAAGKTNGDNDAALGPGFRYLVDVTVAYPNGEPLDLLQILLAHRPACEVAIHYRLIKIDDVPRKSEEELTKFMYRLWEEKENLLDHFYREGVFPGAPRDEANVVDYHLAGLVLHNGIFFALGFLYYYLIRALIGYGMYAISAWM